MAQSWPLRVKAHAPTDALHHQAEAVVLCHRTFDVIAPDEILELMVRKYPEAMAKLPPKKPPAPSVRQRWKLSRQQQAHDYL